MKKEPKTTVIHLLNGKHVRIKKAEVVDIQEQYLIGGGLTWSYLCNPDTNI